MSSASTIEWTDATWNPTRGCEKISPGCKHCYAETFAERFRNVSGHPYEQGFDPRLVPEQLGLPLSWKKPRRIFVDSMSDLFFEKFPFEYIGAVFGAMALCPQHTFQLLTKRADRMEEFFAWLAAEKRGWFHGEWGVCTSALSDQSGKDFGDAWLRAVKHYHGAPEPTSIGDAAMGPWPFPNVHLGVSVEDRKYGVPRIEHLRRTPAAVRFLSIEPLLEDVGELNLTGIHQVIAGAESGRGARAMSEDWVRSIRDQCIAAKVAFFYKQRLDAAGNKVSLPVLDNRQWAEFPR